MKQKTERCKYCLKLMKAKTTRREFCSDKCRVYWNRENSNTPPAQTKKPNYVQLIKRIEKREPAEFRKPSDAPIKQPGESSIDFALRKNEWKKSLNSK